jgi:hypothetical protein
MNEESGNQMGLMPLRTKLSNSPE